MPSSLPTTLRALGERIHFNQRVQQFKARGLRGNLPHFCVALGILLLIYVAAQYGSMYGEQRRLAREWEQQNELTSPVSAKVTVGHSEHDTLTRLSIPKINLDAIVVEGTSRHALLLGPGHLESSVLPGEVGNAVISAHRDTFFRHIYELNKGDDIFVRRDGKVYRYEVTGKRVVQPSDVEVTHNSSDARLTLITCYPTYYIGPAPERLVVFSKLAPDPGDGTGNSLVTPVSESSHQ